ncbi:hypothetical protein ACFPRL_29495 [Pseudoclavibacter helvolus]
MRPTGSAWQRSNKSSPSRRADPGPEPQRAIAASLLGCGDRRLLRCRSCQARAASRRSPTFFQFTMFQNALM